MSRQFPSSREEAFAFQFEDDVKIIKSMSVLSKEAFVKQLSVLQAHIRAYNNKNLQKQCAIAEKESEISRQRRKEFFGGQL